MKLAPASLAIALAINVLPHPGGPYSKNPVSNSTPKPYTEYRKMHKLPLDQLLETTIV